jgi:glycerol-3-phosphate O-acyltransferase
MLSAVEVPLWLVVVLGTLSSIWLLDRVVAPGLRWLNGRRRTKTIDALNQRLNLAIQPFKLAKRKVLVDRLMSDPDILNAIDAEAKATGKPREVLVKNVRSFAREIIPSFSATMYFRVGTRIARRISQSLYRVRLGAVNEAALGALDPNASVVFVINHRSNMDYVLVTYMASNASALSYAVGEWAQIWGLRDIIRSMGAYFIRRNSGDPLYRKVLARYVQTATAAGVVQAVFPEGGLSRDGRLQAPRLGLLSYMVSNFDPSGARDIVFIPVAINYDRVLEDRNLTAAAALKPGEAPRFKFNPAVLIAWNAKALWRRMRGRFYRNGYACVSFGEPVSLRSYLAREQTDFRTLSDQPRVAAINDLGHYLMQKVGRIVPALPVSLVATVLLAARGAPLTNFELKGRVFDLIARLEAAGAHVHVPRSDRDYAIDVGLRMLLMRRLVVQRQGTITAQPNETAILQYYANAIAHLIDTPALARPSGALQRALDAVQSTPASS